jgi:hypothetical protein
MRPDQFLINTQMNLRLKNDTLNYVWTKFEHNVIWAISHSLLMAIYILHFVLYVPSKTKYTAGVYR